MQIHDIVVQVAKPTESFGGQVEEGRYTWEDGTVTLVAEGPSLSENTNARRKSAHDRRPTNQTTIQRLQRQE